MSSMPKPVDSENYFLSGNYTPVMDEHTDTDLKVIGEIPKDLAGHFLRIGPNPVFVPDVASYHLFDGDGMIHQVQFDKGSAIYRNRFVDTAGLRAERKKGTWIWKGMASMADLAKGVPPPEEGPMKNTANTAMVYHNKTLYALMEAAPPHRIDLPGLETIDEWHFNGKLSHPFTAHPKVDAKTGEMMTFGYSPFPPYITYSVVDPKGEIVHTTPVTLPKGVMMHDCAITEHYTIFPDLPATFDMQRAMSGGLMLDWEPENGSRFVVVPRMGKDADAKHFTIETCMMFHVANAWEEGDEIVLHGSRALRTDVAQATELAKPGADMRDQLGQLYEWRLNMKTGDVKERFLDTQYHCDFTRINDDLMGYKSRYTYAAIFSMEKPGLFDGELKYDYDTGELTAYMFGEGRYGGEAIFAPKLGATSEDDGYVIMFVWDDNEQQSECVVLDAQNMKAGPVARILLPHRVPFGFHAGWVPAS